MNRNEPETIVSVKFPKEVEIIFVQANEVKQYELFQWLVALLAPIAVGFWMEYFTRSTNPPVLWSSILFTLIAVIFIWLAYRSRKSLFTGTISKYASIKNFKLKNENQILHPALEVKL